MLDVVVFEGPDVFAEFGGVTNERVTTKKVWRDELLLYLSFSSHNIYIALLLCIEHCFTYIKILHFIYRYISIEKETFYRSYIFQRFFKGKGNATQRLVRILLNFYSSTHLLQPGAQTGTRKFFLVLTIILAINSQV